MSSKISLRKRIALELFSSVRKDLVKEHELKVLFWECTLRCNLNCGHCGSDCRAVSDVKDMPAEDFLRVIDEEVTPHVKPQQVLGSELHGISPAEEDCEPRRGRCAVASCRLGCQACEEF